MDTGQAYLESVYLMTKTEAEKLVLKENASTTSNGDPMMTAAVRPSGMYVVSAQLYFYFNQGLLGMGKETVYIWLMFCMPRKMQEPSTLSV